MQFSKFCTSAQQRYLPPLLDYLHQTQPDHPHTWQDWVVERIWGGQNNLLYHARHEDEDDAVAVKFTQLDERRRASREFRALWALQEAGLELAPVPYGLVEGRYHGRQAVIQSWLDGPVTPTSPQSPAEWARLLDHVLAVQSVRPSDTPALSAAEVAVSLPPATLRATHPRELLAFLRQRAAALPPDATIEPVATLLACLEKREFRDGPTPSLALLHCDPNLRNFVRRPSGWLAVDWENSGWGDPALEIADLMAHAAYMDVPMATWEWVVQQVAERWGDDTAVTRIWAYYPLLLTFWVVIFTQSMYELTHGLPNNRLAPRPPDWAETLPPKYDHYLQIAGNWVIE
ncbi:MAG: phosphotransferase [Anaerolineae bacterium]|nr:phosphotransferase [Anaerolineae bacterium]